MTGREFIIKQIDLTANQMTYSKDVFDVIMFINSPIDGVNARVAYFESMCDASEYATYLINLYDTKYPDMDYACYVLGRCVEQNNLIDMLDAPASESNLIRKK